MRCFIAMPLPDELRDHLARALTSGDKPSNIRRVAENRWHLTIAFLGEVDPKNIPKIIQKLKRNSWSPGTITINKLETFPPLSPTLLVASGDAEPLRAWNDFALLIKHEISSLAPEIDEKPWMAHMTIGRAPRDMKLPTWQKSIGPWTWRPEGFSLVYSNLNPEKAEGYKYLHDFHFKD